MWSLATELGLDREAITPRLINTQPKLNVGTATYRVLAFSIGIGGDFEPVWAFIQMLDNGETPYKTLVLGDTRLTLGDPAAATMTFKIYTQAVGQ